MNNKMLNDNQIMRWVDLNSEEFKSNQDHAMVLRFTLRAIELGAMVANKDGNLYIHGTQTPITDTIKGEKVGVRFCKKAMN